MAKTTNVSLVRLIDGQAFDFEVSHAERTLAIRDSGWALPEDSGFEYKDGTITPRDKGKGK